MAQQLDRELRMKRILVGISMALIMAAAACDNGSQAKAEEAKRAEAAKIADAERETAQKKADAQQELAKTEAKLASDRKDARESTSLVSVGVTRFP